MAPKQAYPLQWPAPWPRARQRERSRFGRHDRKPTIAAATDQVLRELERMGARDVVISSNLLLRLDGLPRSGQPNPTDPGIAVYFIRKGKQQVMAVDAFDLPGCNLHAIAKGLEALRGMERWGCSQLLEQAFVGFQALPPADHFDWRAELGIGATATYQAAQDSYRSLVKTYHPDNASTGDRARFERVQRAWAEAKNFWNI